MKPPPFEYVAPLEIKAVLHALAEHGDDAKVLAGGQSLIPLLNFRFARPALLVDVNRVAGLAGLHGEDGALHIGALTRTAMLERSSLVRERWPLLSEAARHVGHAAIRNRGTVGGSVAHADPAAELPIVLTALGARFHARTATAARVIDAASFFHGALETALAADELLVEIEVPELSSGSTFGFSEFARTAGDFALAGACVVLGRDAAGRCTSAAIVLLGASDVPYRCAVAEQLLAGSPIVPANAMEIAAAAIADCEPQEPVRHRKALLEEMVRVAYLQACAAAAPS